MAARCVIGLLVCLVTGAAHGFTASALWRTWPEARFVETPAPCLRHAELHEALTELSDRHPDAVALAMIGESFQDRPITLLTIGWGERKVLLWSQMHGDEPSATPALLDLAHYLLTHADKPGPRAILDELTLLMIPMLNPDGAELYVRRNAQAIDINRDALSLATPEGRILKEVRDRYQPILGFNLHDQSRRKAVGDTGVLSTSSVLAVAGDPAGTMTPGRSRAKRASSAIVTALAPFMPGGMARYDEDWSPRAFGDNITAWGTPVVLIESGGLPAGHDITDLTRLNFVALLMVLRDLAIDDLAGHDTATYETLPRTKDGAWAEVVIRNGHLLQPGTTKPYRADLSFYLPHSDRQLAGCAVAPAGSAMIFEVGDNRFIGAGREIDGTDTLLVAPFVVGVEGWGARRWLDGTALEQLAKLGVGTLRWAVPVRRVKTAESIVREIEGAGRPRVVVVPAGSNRPPVMIDGPPRVTGSSSLRGILETLGASGLSGNADGLVERMQPLWEGDRMAGLPAMRYGQPASFLLLGPAPGGRLDLEAARIRAIWLDGAEIVQAE